MTNPLDHTVNQVHEFGGDFEFEATLEGGVWTVSLPHSCGSWDIGDPDSLSVFIKEAQAVAEWLREQNNTEETA